jgi:hypothetical protein
MAIASFYCSAKIVVKFDFLAVFLAILVKFSVKFSVLNLDLSDSRTISHFIRLHDMADSLATVRRAKRVSVIVVYEHKPTAFAETRITLSDNLV